MSGTNGRPAREAKGTPRPTAVSLFSGAGGLDLGVEAAGYRVVYAMENDVTAIATLNRNRAIWFPRYAGGRTARHHKA